MARTFLAFGTEGTFFDKAAARPARAAPKPHLVMEGVVLTPRRAPAPAIEWLDLSVGRGEVVSLLGPAGAGKTACLDLLAGFATAERGRLTLGGTAIGHLPPAERNLGLVPRPLSLFPRLTALENAAFPLEARGIGRPEREERAAEALARFGFAGRQDARAAGLPEEDALAVALARATVHGPAALLLDDPFRGLPDSASRAAALRGVLRGLGLTVLHATRDAAAAFALSDRVAVMEGGRVSQVGTPRELYEAPADAVVAALSGEANLLPGTVTACEEDACTLRLDGGLEAVGRPVAEFTEGERAMLLIRPEDVAVAALPPEEMGEDAVAAVLLEAGFAGGGARLRLRLEDGTVLLARRAAHLPLPEPGGTAAVAWDAATARVLPA